MKAEIKSINCDECNFEFFVPKDELCFFITLLVRIGFEHSDAADNFEIDVCTPSWFGKNFSAPKFGRHFLFLNSYSIEAVQQALTDLVDDIQADDWMELAKKLARYLRWEYEDYVE